jgi:hypothetical protein
MLAFAITGAHEDAARTRPAGQFHIAVAISNDDRLMQIYGVLPGRAIQHSCHRLAASAAFGRSVRAIVNSI